MRWLLKKLEKEAIKHFKTQRADEQAIKIADELRKTGRIKMGKHYIGNDVVAKVFNDYITWGGLPQRFTFEQDIDKENYLSSVYDSIILKDIVERLGIKDIVSFNKVLQYIQNNGSITSLECAIHLRIMDLQGVVRDLKKEGYNITSVWEKSDNAIYKRYFSTTYKGAISGGACKDDRSEYEPN